MISLPYARTERNTFLNKILAKVRRLLWQLNSLFFVEIIINTRQGIFALRTGQNENIGKRLYVYGEYELTDLLRYVAILSDLGYADSIKRGCLLDVGANNGVISVGMLISGMVSKAICIEPDKDNFQALQRNIQLNNLSDLSWCIPMAVSDKNCKLLLELSPDNYGDHRIRSPEGGKVSELYRESSRGTKWVKSDSLDAILISRLVPMNLEIGLVVIDVQGYEGFVLAGAEQLLSKGVPVIMEVWPYGIKRSGFDVKRLCSIIQRFYSFFYAPDRYGNYIQYSTTTIDIFYLSIDVGPKYCNILLINNLTVK